jgi:hypothetical protein
MICTICPEMLKAEKPGSAAGFSALKIDNGHLLHVIEDVC